MSSEVQKEYMELGLLGGKKKKGKGKKGKKGKKKKK